jgi:hypothetical protein
MAFRSGFASPGGYAPDSRGAARRMRKLSPGKSETCRTSGGKAAKSGYAISALALNHYPDLLMREPSASSHLRRRVPLMTDLKALLMAEPVR